MGSWFKWAGVVILALAVFFLGGVASHSFGVKTGGTVDLQYAQMIAIVLSALAAILTALAIFLAILGVLGWNGIARGVRARASEFLDEGFGETGEIRRMVNAQVERSTHAYLKGQFSEKGEMRKLVRDQVNQFAYSGFEPVESEDEIGNDAENGGVRE